MKKLLRNNISSELVCDLKASVKSLFVNWQVVSAVSVVAVTILGYFQANIYFGEFGLNYHELAGLSDYAHIFMGKLEFLATLFLMLCMLYIAFKMITLAEQAARGRKGWFGSLPYVLVPAISVYLIYGIVTMDRLQAKAVTGKCGALYDVYVASAGESYAGMGYIGSTSNFLAFYDYNLSVPMLFALSEVKRMVLVRPAVEPIIESSKEPPRERKWYEFRQQKPPRRAQPTNCH